MNGTCLCPEGQYFNREGICDTCQVVGCKECVDGSDTECKKCIDYWADLVDGECDCSWWSKWEKPDYLGTCSYCSVEVVHHAIHRIHAIIDA